MGARRRVFSLPPLSLPLTPAPRPSLLQQNLAAWGTAGVAAYFLWVRPEQEKERARRAARAAREAASLGGGQGDIDRARPVPDPQVGGARTTGG